MPKEQDENQTINAQRLEGMRSLEQGMLAMGAEAWGGRKCWWGYKTGKTKFGKEIVLYIHGKKTDVPSEYQDSAFALEKGYVISEGSENGYDSLVIVFDPDGIAKADGLPTALAPAKKS